MLIEPTPYLILLPAIALCAVLGANNLSACVGSSLGARALKYHQALILASIGLFGGILLEGSKLSGSINGGIIASIDTRLTLSVELSSLALMAFLTYRRLPISLSQVAVGAAIGSAVAEGIGVNWSFTMLVAASWLLTPLSGLMLAFLLSLATKRRGKHVGGVLSRNLSFAYMTVISGIYAAYTLGANTVGLIVGMSESPGLSPLLISIVLGLATILGMLLLSHGTIRSVAENLVGLNPSTSFAAQMGGALTVHGFTEFGIPVSVSQAVVGGVFGATIPRMIVLRNDRLTREIMIGWTVAPLLGAILGLVTSILLSTV